MIKELFELYCIDGVDNFEEFEKWFLNEATIEDMFNMYISLGREI